MNCDRSPYPWNNYAAFTLGLTDTVVSTNDVLVAEIHAVNTHSSAVTITIADGNGKYFAYLQSVDSHADYERVFENGMFFKGGLKIKAGTDAKIDVYVRFRNA